MTAQRAGAVLRVVGRTMSAVDKEEQTFFAPHSGSLGKVTSSGVVTTVAGSEGLSYPAGIAADRKGSLFVAVQSICPKDLALVGPGDPPFCDQPGQVVRLAT